MKLVLKGFIIGIGKIIPGVSGSLLAMMLGVYDKALKSISNFFDDTISNLKFLFKLLIGVLLAIVSTSKILLYFLNNYYTVTMLLFIGLILGGIPNIMKKINIHKLKSIHYLVIILSFLSVISLNFIKTNIIILNMNNFLLSFIIGLIDSFCMIVPGISGTAVMVLLGLYDKLLLIMSFDDIYSLIPFGFGMLLMIIVLSKFITYMFEKRELTSYCFVLGFTLSSVLSLFVSVLNANMKDLIIGFVLLILGFVISKKIEN